MSFVSEAARLLSELAQLLGWIAYALSLTNLPKAVHVAVRDIELCFGGELDPSVLDNRQGNHGVWAESNLHHGWQLGIVEKEPLCPGGHGVFQFIKKQREALARLTTKGASKGAPQVMRDEVEEQLKHAIPGLLHELRAAGWNSIAGEDAGGEVSTMAEILYSVKQLHALTAAEVILKEGMNVWHIDRGHGEVVTIMPDGRAAVKFDNGDLHRYGQHSWCKFSLTSPEVPPHPASSFGLRVAASAPVGDAAEASTLPSRRHTDTDLTEAAAAAAAGAADVAAAPVQRCPWVRLIWLHNNIARALRGYYEDLEEGGESSEGPSRAASVGSRAASGGSISSLSLRLEEPAGGLTQLHEIAETEEELRRLCEQRMKWKRVHATHLPKSGSAGESSPRTPQMMRRVQSSIH